MKLDESSHFCDYLYGYVYAMVGFLYAPVENVKIE